MATPQLATSVDTIRVCDAVNAREFDGEWIILDLRGGNYFGLDQIGGIIWQGLTAGRSLGEIAKLLSESYDTREVAVLQDVLNFVNDLMARGLVRIDEGLR